VGTRGRTMGKAVGNGGFNRQNMVFDNGISMEYRNSDNYNSRSIWDMDGYGINMLNSDNNLYIMKDK
jgi:hypothetical protein